MRPRRLAVLLVVLPALVLSACGGDEPADDSSPSPAATSASPSSAPASPSPSPAAMSPLTGLAMRSTQRVVALKIDNSRLARPYFVGLDRADVVYEELVEGGTTRMLAIFGSQVAPEVGPIRSVRESDLELLAQYGKVLFGFSGGNTGVLRSVKKANVVDVSFDVVPRAYIRGAKRADAYNFFTGTDKLLAARPESDPVKDVGFRFGPAPAPTTPAKGFTVNWSGRATTSFDYDAASGAWLRTMDGRPSTLANGARLGFANVVVQYVPVERSIYTDVNGEHTPYTRTTGSGRVQVFRDGQVITGTWSRPHATVGTRFVDAAKADIALRPGPTWILLVPTNVAAAVR